MAMISELFSLLIIKQFFKHGQGNIYVDFGAINFYLYNKCQKEKSLQKKERIPGSTHSPSS